jgi:hypothetical protein
MGIFNQIRSVYNSDINIEEGGYMPVNSSLILAVCYDFLKSGLSVHMSFGQDCRSGKVLLKSVTHFRFLFNKF